MGKRIILSDYIEDGEFKGETNKNKIFTPSEPVIQNKKIDINNYLSKPSDKNKIFSPIGAVENTALPPPTIANKTFYSNKGTPITFNSKADDKASKAGSVAAGLSNGLSLGIIPKILDSLQPGMSKEAEESNPTAYNVGNLAGYIAPGVAGTKLAKPLLKSITNPLLNKVVEGALVGGGMTGIEDLTKGKTGAETIKDIGINAGIGAGLDLALHGAGKVIPKMFSKAPIKNEIAETIPQIMPSKEVVMSNPVKQYKGKFSIINTDLPKAQSAYDSAVKDIQDLYGHWKLTDEEIKTGAKELGIPLDDILNKLTKAETKGVDIRAVGDNARLLKMAGIDTNPIKPLGNKNSAMQEIASSLNPALGATDRTKSIQQIVSSEGVKPKTTVKDRWDNFYTRFVDSNNPIKKADKETHILATNAKNVNGTIDHIAQTNLVDRSGNVIGESLKNIVKDIPKDEEHDFMNYVLQKHNIDRAREGKNVYQDFTSEQSIKAARLIEQKHPEYKTLNDRLIKFVNDFQKEWTRDSGLISDDLWDNLNETYKNYVPTQRSFETLEHAHTATNGRGVVNQGNTLNRATGSERDIINPIENIMNMVNRTVRTAKYNEVGQSLVRAIEENPTKLNKLAEIIPAGEAINPNLNNIVSVLVKGEPVNIRIKDEALLNSLEGIHKANIDDLDGFVKKLNNGFKALITTKNPVFAARNIFRDIPTYLINSTEKNPVKLIGNLGGAVKDLLTNSEVAQQYHALGGGGSNFVNSNNMSKTITELTGRKPIIDKAGLTTGYKDINPVKKAFNKIGDTFEKINSVTESAPRLAEFKNSIQRGDSLDKAMYNSNDVTTNFSRSGDIAKKIDNYVPFANAGVQGLDKLARQLDPRNPKKLIGTLTKGAAAVTVPTMIADHMNKDNPNYQKLDNRTKDNNILLPNIFGTKDSSGNAETFIKIPKSREYGVMFGSLIERTSRKASGEKNAFKDYGSTAATNFAPANPLTDNLFAPAANIGLGGNKDFAGRAIVPQSMLSDGRSKYLQYDEKSTELSKKIAEVAHNQGMELSPKQIDYLIKSYTGVIAQIGQPLLTKQTMSEGTGLSKALKPITSQFVADPVYSNNGLNDFYDNLNKMSQRAADKNILEKVPSKKVTAEEKQKSIFTKASTDISKLNKEIIKAEQNNDINKVRELRKKVLDIAIKTNASIKE